MLQNQLKSIAIITKLLFVHHVLGANGYPDEFVRHVIERKGWRIQDHKKEWSRVRPGNLVSRAWARTVGRRPAIGW